jgi:acylphosphatase
MLRVHLHIKGKVQGVMFCQSVKSKAQELGINGWVKNNADGTVETLFEGNLEKMERLIKFCKKGPKGAKVEMVKIVKEKYLGELIGFDIR